MLTARNTHAWTMTAMLALLASACASSADGPLTPPESQQRVVEMNEPVSVTWNRRGTSLLVLRPPSSNVPAMRLYAYLSLAQYRAAGAVEAASRPAPSDQLNSGPRTLRPSLRAAVSSASVQVLGAFFPLDRAVLDSELAALFPQRDAATLAGLALGDSVGAAVVAFAASDNVGVANPGVPPVGAGYWVSSSAPISKGLYGARPFFLVRQDELRSPPPPVFGSPEYLEALAKVRALSDNRTPEQLAIAVFWNQASAPFGPGYLNGVADDLIVERRTTEADAARILAYANAAVFDAQIGCSDTKFAYWYIRPSQADPGITLPIGLPNHPSYPSAHSCITSSFLAVLGTEFRSEQGRFADMVREAGLSRMYGGIHYKFDVEAGQEIGRKAAALALSRRGLE